MVIFRNSGLPFHLSDLPFHLLEIITRTKRWVKKEWLPTFIQRKKMIPARSKTSKVRGVLGGKILQKNGPSCMQSSAFFFCFVKFSTHTIDARIYS